MLSRRPGLAIFHRELPPAFPRWSALQAPLPDRPVASTVVEPPPETLDRVDAGYRMVSPFRARDPINRPAVDRSVTFMVTEAGLAPVNFASELDRRALLDNRDERIVTPSAWSADRLHEHGFAPERVHVVPHGVDRTLFRPPDPAQRDALRARLGIRPDETLFLNIGAPIWTKGFDLLLDAFAVLRLRGLPARLLLKDQRALYGRTVDAALEQLCRDNPRIGHETVRTGIVAAPNDVADGAVAALLGAADVYVSPYRAEGFNLPVLEALGCGTTVIVTAGGATDAFCDDRVAIRVPGRFGRRPHAGSELAFIEPDRQALSDAMAMACERRAPAPDDAAREAMLRAHSWERAADALATLLFG